MALELQSPDVGFKVRVCAVSGITSRAAAVALLASVLFAGCAGKPLTEPTRMAGEPAAFGPVTTGPVKLVQVTPAIPQSPLKGQAVVLLPDDAAPVKTVRERHHANGTRQEIVLDTWRHGAGEGVIDVSVQTAPAREGRQSDLQLYRPTEDNIRNEIIGRFPDAKMNFVSRAYGNSFGPVGVAIGRHPSGATCVFAWQWIDDLRATKASSSGFDRLGTDMAGSANPASVRIRLCRRDLTADQIVAYIEQLRLGSPDALRRLVQMDRSRADGSVQPVDDNGVPAASNSVLRPVAAGSLESLLPQSKKAPLAAAAPAAVATARARPAATTPRRLVRAKPRDQDWRNQPAYLDRAQQPERAPRQSPDDTSTGRFLAPVQSAQIPVTQVPAAQAPVVLNPAPTSQSTQRPGSDLPLEAFRGPTTQQARPLSR